MSEVPVAILTGGAQGLGAAICVVLLNNGYKVCVSDILEEKGKEFVKKQQRKYGAESVKFVRCDVSKEKDYEDLFQFALKEFGKIDLVINNAGVILESNPRKTIDINLMGTIIGCKLALKYMGKSNGGKGGMVINTASIGSFIPNPALPVYIASKYAIVGLTRSYGLPYHFEREGVTFSAICPFMVDTELLVKCGTDSLVEGYDPVKVDGEQLMSPDDAAKSILKLLEDKINGSTLLVSKKGFTYIGYQEEFKDIGRI